MLEFIKSVKNGKQYIAYHFCYKRIIIKLYTNRTVAKDRADTKNEVL